VISRSRGVEFDDAIGSGKFGRDGGGCYRAPGVEREILVVKR
jgi:hypothetical protein